MRSFTAIVALAVASLASAATIDVKAGADGLTFTPNSVTAAVGDTINFEFYPKNHTLTQSTFAKPCTAMDGGFNSGFVPVAADATEHPVWSLTVQNASAPLWFYCAQGPHCVMGMVFAFNPTAEKSIDKFVETAKASGGAAGGSASASAPAAGSTTGAGAGTAGGATTGSTGSSGSSGAGAGAGSTTGSTAGAGGASAASASASAGASQVGAASANANGAASLAGAPVMLMAAFFGVFSLLL